MACQEAARIFFGGLALVGLFQGEVRLVAEGLHGEGRLAGLPGPGDGHHGVSLGQLLEGMARVTKDHGGNVG